MEKAKEEDAGHVEARTINKETAPTREKEKENLEDLTEEENGEKDSKEEKDLKEEKEKGALTAETQDIMPENAHTRKEKEKEDPLMNLLKETTKKRKRNQR